MSPTELLQHVEAALATTGLSPSKFGLAAVGDPSFVFALREGREPRRRTVEKVLDFIAKQREAA